MGNFDMLPSHITIDILSRLPAETILECKLVCKPWRNLVRHPSLSKLHLINHFASGKSSFIFYSAPFFRDSNIFYYSEYDDNCHEAPFNGRKKINISHPFYGCSLVGSCNGLVCMSGSVIPESGLCTNGPIYICNPITREYIILPTSEEEKSSIGFGYTLSTEEYKVVRISAPAERGSNVSAVQVYTLGSGKGWRNVGTIDISMRDMSEHTAFANEAIHWVNRQGSGVLAFHLADEIFSQLPPPPVPSLSPDGVQNFSIEVGVLGDSLSVTYNYYTRVPKFKYYVADYSNNDSEIWVLKKTKDNSLSWSKEFTFDTEILPPFEFTKSGRLLCGARGGSTQLGHIRSYKPEVCSYNLRALSTEITIRFEEEINDIIPHKNTLISLKVLGEKDTKTMECGESASSIEQTENNDKLMKPQNEVRDPKQQ